MPTVLSDTSPVRALAHLGHLDWLALLFGQVILPPAVDAELRNPSAGLPAVDTQAFPFIRGQGQGGSVDFGCNAAEIYAAPLSLHLIPALPPYPSPAFS
jgi:hypothetical protein